MRMPCPFDGGMSSDGAYLHVCSRRKRRQLHIAEGDTNQDWATWSGMGCVGAFKLLRRRFAFLRRSEQISSLTS